MADIEGFDSAQLAALQQKLDALTNVGEVVKPALVAGAELIRGETGVYPPQTAANHPPAEPPGTYYKRGTGPVYVRKATTYTKAGRVNKKRSILIDISRHTVYFGGETVRKTSQDLGGSWSITYNLTRDQAEARIGNSASYAKYAHDERKQARWMKAIGWRTAQATLRKHGGQIVANIKQAIDAVIAR
jgi:hypothetical protein